MRAHEGCAEVDYDAAVVMGAMYGMAKGGEWRGGMVGSVWMCRKC